MIDVIGWIGGFLLAICAVPQAIESYRTKHSNGITWSLLWFWGLGEIFTLVYVGWTNWKWPLIFNYICNLGAISVIGWYKLRR